MKLLKREGESALYALGDGVRVVTTPESRAICNDPRLFGLQYTRLLRQACVKALGLLELPLQESEANVVHLLRGGLNFGLREALGEAYGWNAPSSTFLSAQRKRTLHDPEEWEIGESEYRKLVLPKKVSFVFGDVVASGASLKHGLEVLLSSVRERGVELRSILFFTIGGPRTEEVFHEAESRIRAEHPDYQGTTLVYFEGRFPVAERETSLRIKHTGTDLLRHGPDQAPEFLESQYSNPMFPVERCTIYDAGSRAFDIPTYLEDVLEYWSEVRRFHDLCFTDYLRERCPNLDSARFPYTDLKELAESQVVFLRNELRRLK